MALETVPCGGRIDPRYILKAFEGGALAVLVLACPKGHCKSMEGNLRALRRVNFVKDLLAEAGLDAGSVQVQPTGKTVRKRRSKRRGSRHPVLRDRRRSGHEVLV